MMNQQPQSSPVDAVKCYAQGLKLLYQFRQSTSDMFDFISNGLEFCPADEEPAVENADPLPPASSPASQAPPSLPPSAEESQEAITCPTVVTKEEPSEHGSTDKISSSKQVPDLTAFSRKFKQRVSSVMESMDQLEKLINAIPVQRGPLGGQNLHLLVQNYLYDPQNQTQNHYEQILQTYNWAKKSIDFSTFASKYLASLNRMNQSNIKRFSIQAKSGPNDSDLEKLLQFVSKNLIGLQYTIIRRGGRVLNNGSNIDSGIVLLTLNLPSSNGQEAIKSPIMKLALLVKNFNIEWVSVKGVDEEFYDRNGNLELWTPSRYELFRKLSSYFKRSLLSLCTNLQFNNNPNALQTIMKQFLQLVHTYRFTFYQPCVMCKQYLKNFLPPYIRDLRMMDHVLHENCR